MVNTKLMTDWFLKEKKRKLAEGSMQQATSGRRPQPKMPPNQLKRVGTVKKFVYFCTFLQGINKQRYNRRFFIFAIWMYTMAIYRFLFFLRFFALLNYSIFYFKMDSKSSSKFKILF